MQFRHLTPMIWTNDMRATVDFYVEKLGFTIDNYREDWNWSHIHRDTICFMITQRTIDDHYDGKPLYTGSFYMYIDDVDQLWEQVKDNTTVFYGIQNFAHRMREFSILDNNGYILQFGREMKDDELVDECD